MKVVELKEVCSLRDGERWIEKVSVVGLDEVVKKWKGRKGVRYDEVVGVVILLWESRGKKVSVDRVLRDVLSKGDVVMVSVDEEVSYVYWRFGECKVGG